MGIGAKIAELRKKSNLSQEELAEKIGVARQTISKWELGETSPDLKQAKEISKIFKVSLDALVDNNVRELIVEKVSNTEKLAGLVLKVLKGIGILFIIFLVINIIFLILFTVVRKNVVTKEQLSQVGITCFMNDREYTITIDSDDILIV